MKDDYFCATYFSQLLPENEIKEEFYNKLRFVFTTSHYIEKVSLHSPLVPPQLTTLKTAGCLLLERFRLLHKILKPIPYDTKCINYNVNTRFRSQYDCKVRCRGQSVAQMYPTVSKWVKGYGNSTKPNNWTPSSCSRQCQNQCHYRYYEITPMAQIDFGCPENQKARYIFEKVSEETFIEHQEKMILVYVFVQAGGLVSLWFGFAFIQTAQFLKYRIALKEVTFSLYLLLKAICIYQITVVTFNYFKYETTTNVFVYNSYEKVGVMPRIDINTKSGSIVKTFNEDLLKTDVTCQLNFWNGTKIKPDFVKTTSTLENFKYTFGYRRERLKSVIYTLNQNTNEVYFVLIGEGYSNVDAILTLSGYGIYTVSVRQQTFEHLYVPYEPECVPETDRDYPNDIYDRKEQCTLECMQQNLKKPFGCFQLIEDYYYLRNENQISVGNLNQIKNCMLLGLG